MQENNPWGQEPHFHRASRIDLLRVFRKYATVKIDGEYYMTLEVFIRKFLGILPSENYHKRTLELLGGIIDTSKDGLISFIEFQAFEGCLCVPDALYSTAFRLFDTSGSGYVTFPEFQSIIRETVLQKKIPFDLDGPFVELYFGPKKERVVTYSEFSQFLHDFHEAYAIEAFKRFDDDGTGYISLDDFYEIMTSIRGHLLTDKVKERLKPLVVGLTGNRTVSFPFFMALNRLLSNMELMKKMYLHASGGKPDKEISKDAFLGESQLVNAATPLETDILFWLSDSIHESPTMIYRDFDAMTPEQYYKKVHKRIIHIKAVQNPGERNFVIEMLENLYRLALGTAAGAAGAISVYPLDLVKTRMQVQRPSHLYDYVQYRSNFDCFFATYRKEGARGLYRGLLPQVQGVAMGKAVKLTVNDFLRDKFMDRKGRVPLWGETLAGACAGASNSLLVNPLEIIKIRIQLAGEVRQSETSHIKYLKIAKNLGVRGLYTGLIPCLLRDIPFCAVFFPLYADMKIRLQDNNHYNTPLSLISAAAIASIPAAPLSIPFDVIKTRIQAEPKLGQTRYYGVLDATKKIYNEEGLRAFWRGSRFIKPSSQFGVTLMVYELLQRIIYVDFAGTKPTGSEATVLITGLNQVKSMNPDHVGGYALALPILSGVESKFGLILPKVNAEQIQ